MAIKVKSGKQYRIYIKESKSWVDVNESSRTTTVKSTPIANVSGEHGRCVCPVEANDIYATWTVTCPYVRRQGDRLFLDNTVSDGEGNEKSWLDDMPDESAAIAALMEDAELLRALYAKLNELDTEGRLICQLIMEGKSERDCGKEMGLSRNTFCIPQWTSYSRSFVQI